MTQLDVRPWFRSDLRQLIAGLNYLNSQRAESEQYRAGFTDALIALCLLCGIDPLQIGAENDYTIES